MTRHGSRADAGSRHGTDTGAQDEGKHSHDAPDISPSVARLELKRTDSTRHDLASISPSPNGKKTELRKAADAEQSHVAPASLDELIQRPTPIYKEDFRGKQPTLKVTEKTDDLFDNANNTVLVHACNCQGKWGAGIAAAFKKKFPKAFTVYAEHCKKNAPSNLIGTALLIPPEEESLSGHSTGIPVSRPWIACIFTSIGHGRSKDPKSSILSNTYSAMKHLLLLVSKKHHHHTYLGKPASWNTDSEENTSNLRDVGILAIRMCRINSGLFNVPWKETIAVLESVEVGTGEFLEVEVVSPVEEMKGKGGKKAGTKRASSWQTTDIEADEDGPVDMGPPKRKRRSRVFAADGDWVCVDG